MHRKSWRVRFVALATLLFALALAGVAAAGSFQDPSGGVTGSPPIIVGPINPGNGGSIHAPGVSEPSVAAVTPNSTSNGLCSGWWYWPTANVYFWTASGGTLNWDFYLPATAQGELGPFVTVSMPYAYVNGKPINPPYAPHYEPSSYDFHSSMRNYQYIPGPAGGTVKSGDVLTFYWWMAGSSGTDADRYITCTMP